MYLWHDYGSKPYSPIGEEKRSNYFAAEACGIHRVQETALATHIQMFID
jgi:hypothetical protein